MEDLYRREDDLQREGNKVPWCLIMIAPRVLSYSTMGAHTFLFPIYPLVMHVRGRGKHNAMEEIAEDYEFGSSKGEIL